MSNFNLNGFIGVNALPVAIELLEYISQDLFTIKDTGITQRAINNWDKEGILPKQGSFDGLWRRFSFVDFMWLKFINELRKVGVPLSQIRKLREELFEPISGATVSEILEDNPQIINNLPDDEFKPLIANLFKDPDYEKLKQEINYGAFHFLLLSTIINKENNIILVFSQGENLIWNENNKEFYPLEDLERKSTETHVFVSLLKIVKDFMIKDHKLELSPKLKLFEEHELKVLEIINSGNYNSIKVIFKDKKLKPLEIKKKDNDWRKTINLFMANEFSEIEIKSEKGAIMKIHNTRGE